MHQINTTTKVMKPIYLIVFVILFFSCGEEKSVLLPEIENAITTEILDVSPVYVFYNEAQPDSVELNRKNLIGTTNWLFNIDKRLTLEQVIPKIKFLQDKKRNAQMHKNENAKNYFTCHDTSIQNLGFIEFTEVSYQPISLKEYFSYMERPEKMGVVLNTISEGSYSLESYYNEQSRTEVYSNIENVVIDIKKLFNTDQNFKLYLLFNSAIRFQEYIVTKSKIQDLYSLEIPIDKNEFIY